jgi:dimeric dUTPase (all-alpha-NTP-PPase superfamily)
LSERKGNHWLELTRNWILEANQAKNLILEENFSGMKHFLQRISLNRQISEQKILINFTKLFDFLAKLSAETSGEAPSEMDNSIWWTLAESNR